jgi:hypothetical protein
MPQQFAQFGPGSPSGGDDRAAAFFGHLEATLPHVYDFAFRLFQAPEACDQAIETALRSMLRSPGDYLTSEAKFRALLMAEVYVIAESTPSPGVADDLRLSSPAGWAPAALSSDTAASIWEVARGLPLQEYAALHLQTRVDLTRDGVADALGLTPAYAFILLERARRHFADGFSAAILLRNEAGRCPQFDEVRQRFSQTVDIDEARSLTGAHLATGCPECQAVLSPYSDIGGLLGALGPVAPPEDLLARLKTRLRERALAMTQTAPVPARAQPAVFAAPPATVRRPTLHVADFDHDGSRSFFSPRSPAFTFVLGCLLTLLAVSVVSALLQRPATELDVGVEVLGVPQAPSRGEDRESMTVEAPTPPAEATSETATTAVAGPREETSPSATPTVASTQQSTPEPTASPAATEAPAPATATPRMPRTVAAVPSRVQVSHETLHFQSNETVKPISLSSSGPDQLRWQALPQQAWIIASPGAGTIGDAPATLQIKIDRSLAGPRSRQGSLIIDSTGGQLIVRITAD